MTCPDTERLLEALIDGHSSPEIDAHIQGCHDCRSTARLLRSMRAAYLPELRLPADLVEDRVSLIVGELAVDGSRATPSTALDALISGLLAVATVALTVVATGSLGEARPEVPIVLALAAGVAAVLRERSLGDERIPAP